MQFHTLRDIFKTEHDIIYTSVSNMAVLQLGWFGSLRIFDNIWRVLVVVSGSGGHVTGISNEWRPGTLLIICGAKRASHNKNLSGSKCQQCRDQATLLLLLEWSEKCCNIGHVRRGKILTWEDRKGRKSSG